MKKNLVLVKDRNGNMYNVDRVEIVSETETIVYVNNSSINFQKPIIRKTITTFNEYQSRAIEMRISLDKFIELHPDISEDVILILKIAYDGLGMGEAGEVQGKIKKIIRDNGGIIDDTAKNAIKAELGDALWYMASMCQNLGITLEEVATHNIEKLIDRTNRGVRHGNGDYR